MSLKDQVAQRLKEQLGREPTSDEIYDEAHRVGLLIMEDLYRSHRSQAATIVDHGNDDEGGGTS
jgi:hypothetical protein